MKDKIDSKCLNDLSKITNILVVKIGQSSNLYPDLANAWYSSWDRNRNEDGQDHGTKFNANQNSEKPSSEEMTEDAT